MQKSEASCRFPIHGTHFSEASYSRIILWLIFISNTIKVTTNYKLYYINQRSHQVHLANQFQFVLVLCIITLV